MLKSPISVLQEYAAKQKILSPVYEFSFTSSTLSHSYTCHAKMLDNSVVVTGQSKKEAKHNAALKLLPLLNLETYSDLDLHKIPSIYVMPNGHNCPLKNPIFNFIGKLNELCTSLKIPLPSYAENLWFYNNQFAIRCSLLEFCTEGRGSTKKVAKQEAAQMMLVELKKHQVTDFKNLTAISRPLSVEVIQFNTADVLEKYENFKGLKLSEISCLKDANKNHVNIENDNEKVSISNWEDFERYASKMNWKYDVFVFQSNPLILRLKINDFVLLAYGDADADIYQKFAEQIGKMLDQKFDFNLNLSDASFDH